MKRFTTGDSPSKWKRIIGPVDDSDSSSSSSFDELYGQHVCDFRTCARCNRPTYGCKCNRLESAGLVSNPQTTQFAGAMTMDADQTIEDPSEMQAGPSGIDTRRSRNSNLVNENTDENVSVSFRASTSIEAFTEQKLLDYLAKRRTLRLEVSAERPMNGLLNSYCSNRSPFFADPLAATEVNGVNQSEDNLPVTNLCANRTTRSENATEQQETRSGDEETSAKAELEQLHAKLIGLLECPVCLEPIVPPIHQCRRGHLVCARCKVQLSQCPTCRDRMSDARNWAIERIAEQLRYPCRNSTSGCQIKMPLSQKEEHESGCTFRLFACPFRTCSWTGFLPDMLPHLRETHATRFLEGELQQIDVELNSPTLFYTDWAISCLSEVFRLNVFQNIPNSMLYASCYYLGAPNRAADFTYTISLSGSQNRRITYTRQTHSESTKMSSLCASSDCFLVKGDVIKYFVNEGKLNLKVHFERSQ